LLWNSKPGSSSFSCSGKRRNFSAYNKERMLSSSPLLLSRSLRGNSTLESCKRCCRTLTTSTFSLSFYFFASDNINRNEPSEQLHAKFEVVQDDFSETFSERQPLANRPVLLQQFSIAQLSEEPPQSNKVEEIPVMINFKRRMRTLN